MKLLMMSLTATALVGSATAFGPVSAQGTAGSANPAAAYCQKLGGRSIVRDTSAGEVGYCRLRNGRTVDEWKLFRDANQPRRRAGSRAAPIGTRAVNPASAYCEGQGGLTKAKMTEEGEIAFCHLPGGRVIEEWEFFRQSQAR